MSGPTTAIMQKISQKTNWNLRFEKNPVPKLTLYSLKQRMEELQDDLLHLLCSWTNTGLDVFNHAQK